MNVGSIVATLRLNIQDFVNGIRQAQNSMNSWTNGGTSGMNNMSSSADNLTNHLKSVERIVEGILVSQLFYRMTNQIQDAASASLQFMQNMEKSQVAMKYFLGNQKDANAFIMNMQDFAADTSFSTEQAMYLSRRLMAAQFDPKQVRSVMEILNDASSATGGTPEQLDRIVLALTQIKTNGKLAGQEIRQLAEANVPVYKILEEQLGLTSKQIMNIGKIHIPGEVAVQAILKGLQDRYQGAAQEISDTWAGMVETIKDDALMITDNLFQKPYAAVESFIRKVRDKFETVRKAGFKFGAGGILESMFSPETQTYVRLIVGSLDSIIHSLGELGAALKPIASMVSAWFTQAFANALPVIAMFLQQATSITVALLNAAPSIQYFVGAVMSILVVNTVSKVLLIFWRVVGLGSICTAVANAVRKLASALQLVMILMVENPLTALFILLAGALAYLAMQIKSVQNAFSGLYKTLGTLAGFSVDKVLAPKINTAADSMDTFDQSVTAGVTGLKNVGKSLDDAAKKAKKMKDVMSFDEVFRLDDSMADAAKNASSLADGLGGVGGLSDYSNPKYDAKKDMDIGQYLNGSQHPAKSMWQNIWDDLKRGVSVTIEWLKDAGDKISGWFTWLGGAAIYGTAKFVKWIIDGIGDAKDAIFTWTVNTLAKFVWWFNGVTKNFEDWSIKTTYQLSVWAVGAFNAVTKWVTDTLVSFANWSTNAGASFARWAGDALTTLGNWERNAGKAIEDWTRSALYTIGNWTVSALTSIGNWTVNALKAIGGWSTSAINALSSWASNAVSPFTTWATNSYHAFTSWFSNGLSSISSWGVSTAKEFGNVATNSVNALTSGFNKMISSIGNVFSNMYNLGIKPGLNLAIDGINSFINTIDNIKVSIPKIDLGPLGKHGGQTFTIANIPQIPHLATGGIVLKDQLVRMGEGNKREAVVPLQNPSYMKPFSDAVATQVLDMIGGAGISSSNRVTNLNVGVLIGDDRSYRELERRLKVIRQNEDTRIGGLS